MTVPPGGADFSPRCLQGHAYLQTVSRGNEHRRQTFSALRHRHFKRLTHVTKGDR